jgi:hypothetical protein
MKPTPKLRFVEREISNPYEFELGKYITQTKTVRILQQWWETEEDDGNPVTRSGWCPGKWRDVPVEKEQA